MIQVCLLLILPLIECPFVNISLLAKQNIIIIEVIDKYL